MQYQLKRSRKRRTVSLSIRNAEVVVQAPHWLPKHEIDAFVLDKRSWIAKQFALEQSQAQAKRDLGMNVGDHCLFLGERYRIVLREPDLLLQDEVYLDQDTLCVHSFEQATELTTTLVQRWCNDKQSTAHRPHPSLCRAYSSTGCAYWLW